MMLKLTPLHIKLLKRGASGKWIGLSDDMMFRIGEIAALGELQRMGYVEDTTDDLPPGPPSLTPSVITDAGREALRKAGEEGEEMIDPVIQLQRFIDDIALPRDQHDAMSNAADEIIKLRKENFALAAFQCPHGYGDEGGMPRCSEVERLESALENLVMNVSRVCLIKLGQGPGHDKWLAKSYDNAVAILCTRKWLK